MIGPSGRLMLVEIMRGAETRSVRGTLRVVFWIFEVVGTSGLAVETEGVKCKYRIAVKLEAR